MLRHACPRNRATKYDTAAVAAGYMDAAKADAKLTLVDLQALGSQIGVKLEAATGDQSPRPS